MPLFCTDEELENCSRAELAHKYDEIILRERAATKSEIDELTNKIDFLKAQVIKNELSRLPQVCSETAENFYKEILEKSGMEYQKKLDELISVRKKRDKEVEYLKERLELVEKSIQKKKLAEKELENDSSDEDDNLDEDDEGAFGGL